jgi:hypothetical protein
MEHTRNIAKQHHFFFWRKRRHKASLDLFRSEVPLSRRITIQGVLHFYNHCVKFSKDRRGALLPMRDHHPRTPASDDVLHPGCLFVPQLTAHP